MKKQSLLKTNPYLADPQKREYLLKKSVLSSTAVEGVHAAAERALGLKKNSNPNEVEVIRALKKQRIS